MNINLHIEASSPAELQEAIAGLAGIVGGAVAAQEEKPKRTSRTTTKPEKQQDPEPVNEPGAENADSPNSESSDPENIPSVVELRAAAQAKGQTAEDKKAIKALLDEFGSKSISDVPEEKRAAFLAKLEAL